MDKIKRRDNLSLLNNTVKEMLDLALIECRRQGLWVYPFETWRSFERQADRYRQGRDPAYPGDIVTHAEPGNSFHHYGLAVDLVFDGDHAKPGTQWTWKGDYPAVAQILQRHGFEWGRNWKSFKEDAHFQMTFGLTIDEVKKIYLEGGAEAVSIKVDELVAAGRSKVKDMV